MELVTPEVAQQNLEAQLLEVRQLSAQRGACLEAVIPLLATASGEQVLMHVMETCYGHKDVPLVATVRILEHLLASLEADAQA